MQNQTCIKDLVGVEEAAGLGEGRRQGLSWRKPVRGAPQGGDQLHWRGEELGRWQRGGGGAQRAGEVVAEARRRGRGEVGRWRRQGGGEVVAARRGEEVAAARWGGGGREEVRRWRGRRELRRWRRRGGEVVVARMWGGGDGEVGRGGGAWVGEVVARGREFGSGGAGTVNAEKISGRGQHSRLQGCTGCVATPKKAKNVCGRGVSNRGRRIEIWGSFHCAK